MGKTIVSIIILCTALLAYDSHRVKAAEVKAAELKAIELKAAELKAIELKAAELKAMDELKTIELKAAELNKKRMLEKVAFAQQFIRDNDYNDEVCFLIDMRIPKGTKRFFVYDLKNNNLLESGLVAHGSGSEVGKEELSFSNVPNSLATSLGKYKIGVSYQGNFGLSYKLDGLEETNNNAFKRLIVVHAHSCVPDDDVFPLPICDSWGCPTVAPDFLETIRPIIDTSEKPILLWIYY